MGMFDNYPQPEDYIPDNRPRCPKEFKLDIMTGETASHTFDIPFDVNEDCQKVEVIYKLGLKVVVNKSNPNTHEIDVVSYEKECGGKTIKWSTVTAHLSDKETLYFHDTYLNARVQLRFTMNDGAIQYSEIYPVKVVDSLDGEETSPVPPPSVVIGFGWTED